MLMNGDLVRVPADTTLWQLSKDPRGDRCVSKRLYTREPSIGIFVEYLEQKKVNDVMIFLANDYWIVSIKKINFMEAKC